MIEICAIASGSNGNCYYIGNSTESVVVDAGISCRQIMLRMYAKKLKPSKIKAIFVTHEHIDHCSGVKTLSKRVNAPVYMTSQTYNRLRVDVRPQNVKIFTPGETITVGSFTIHTCQKRHDAVEPCGFRIEYEGISVGVFTDLGSACGRVVEQVSQCHALFLESNYDDAMLWAGSYRQSLKKRIASKYGHLSNHQAVELVRQHHHPGLQLVLLSHLSAENNRPEIAASVFDRLRNQFKIELTSRDEASEVYRIEKTILAEPSIPIDNTTMECSV